ncbi:MAG: DoxX family protein [Rhodobacteraceae bacterium]|nr:DoxX family protein [Paracoccaceae bacterium]
MFDLQRLKDSLAVLQGRAAADHQAAPPPGPGSNALETQAFLALMLRVGLGAVFVVGGLAKLSRLLSPTAADGIVAEYMGPLGYINATFQEWLFSGLLGQVLTPWMFLTALSAFELLAGLMLIAGLFVRAMAVFWAGLLWTFVVSLPVVTTPGVTLEATTYSSPAMFVQIRDIALSGLFVVLYLLGSGERSLDAAWLRRPMAQGVDWEPLGLLIRWSLGLMLLIGGLFNGYHKVPTFGASGEVLALIGLGLIAGVYTRAFALAAFAVIAWYMLGKIAGASDLLGYANSVKREIALVAGALALAISGGGARFTVFSIWAEAEAGWKRIRAALGEKPKNAKAA